MDPRSIDPDLPWLVRGRHEPRGLSQMTSCERPARTRSEAAVPAGQDSQNTCHNHWILRDSSDKISRWNPPPTRGPPPSNATTAPPAAYRPVVPAGPGPARPPSPTTPPVSPRSPRSATSCGCRFPPTATPANAGSRARPSNRHRSGRAAHRSGSATPAAPPADRSCGVSSTRSGPPGAGGSSPRRSAPGCGSAPSSRPP